MLGMALSITLGRMPGMNSRMESLMAGILQGSDKDLVMGISTWRANN
jgi:hypothetical protein